MRAHEQCRAAQRERRVGGVQRLQAAVPERRARPEDARARAGDGGIPAERGQPVMQRRGGRDRLAVGAAVRRARREMAREQPVVAQLAHDARVPAGQRATRRLDVAEPGLRGGPRERPCERRELAVQGEHGHRPPDRQLRRRGHPVRVALLDGRDGVLEARVVELHDVRARRPLAAEAARQVDVDDVEAARPEPELDGLDVDDHLVAGLRRADEADVGDRRAAVAVDVDRQALLHRARRARDEHLRAPQAEHSSSSANVTSSMPSSAATLTRSRCSWLYWVPLATFVQ